MSQFQFQPPSSRNRNIALTQPHCDSCQPVTSARCPGCSSFDISSLQSSSSSPLPSQLFLNLLLDGNNVIHTKSGLLFPRIRLRLMESLCLNLLLIVGHGLGLSGYSMQSQV